MLAWCVYEWPHVEQLNSYTFVGIRWTAIAMAGSLFCAIEIYLSEMNDEWSHRSDYQSINYMRMCVCVSAGTLSPLLSGIKALQTSGRSKRNWLIVPCTWYFNNVVSHFGCNGINPFWGWALAHTYTPGPKIIAANIYAACRRCCYVANKRMRYGCVGCCHHINVAASIDTPRSEPHGVSESEIWEWLSTNWNHIHLPHEQSVTSATHHQCAILQNQHRNWLEHFSYRSRNAVYTWKSVCM